MMAWVIEFTFASLVMMVMLNEMRREERYQFENDYVKLVIGEYLNPLFNGEREAKRCEKCEYCRLTKKLRALGVIEVSDLLAE